MYIATAYVVTTNNNRGVLSEWGETREVKSTREEMLADGYRPHPSPRLAARGVLLRGPADPEPGQFTDTAVPEHFTRPVTAQEVKVMPRFFVNATLGPLKGGWEGWITQPALSTGKLPTREEARAALLDMLTGWVERNGHDMADFDVRWFDPAKHFRHCDKAIVYPDRPQDEPLRGAEATFLAYDTDCWGRPVALIAYVGAGFGQCYVSPSSLKPLDVRHPW